MFFPSQVLAGRDFRVYLGFLLVVLGSILRIRGSFWLLVICPGFLPKPCMSLLLWLLLLLYLWPLAHWLVNHRQRCFVIFVSTKFPPLLQIAGLERLRDYSRESTLRMASGLVVSC